jgi:hypothetical protein
MNTLYEFDMNNLNILDLPDEILLIIFHKVNMVDVLYSVVDVNQRFARLALDSLYIRNLDMTNIMTINSLYDHTSSINTTVLSKICSKILPRIRHQVQKLTVEEYSMKEIVCTHSYPRLHWLSLINFEEETLYLYLKGIAFDFICFNQKTNNQEI